VCPVRCSPSAPRCQHLIVVLFPREQRHENLSVSVAISRGNGVIGDRNRESDMERDYQIEATELTDEELQAVSGGLPWTAHVAIFLSYVVPGAGIAGSGGGTGVRRGTT
jgi:bacteriocin-like protein